VATLRTTLRRQRALRRPPGEPVPFGSRADDGRRSCAINSPIGAILLEDMTLLDVAGIVVLFVVIGIPLIWLKARIVSSGELSREWGTPDDDDARAEIESIFPGATKPLEPGEERPISRKG
jgi:hypothetical protein